jgi:hypothetical protein
MTLTRIVTQFDAAIDGSLCFMPVKTAGKMILQRGMSASGRVYHGTSILPEDYFTIETQAISDMINNWRSLGGYV